MTDPEELPKAIERIREIAKGDLNWKGITELYPAEWMSDGDDGVQQAISDDHSIMVTDYLRILDEQAALGNADIDTNDPRM